MEGTLLRYTKGPSRNSRVGECALTVADPSSNRTAHTLPPWVVLQPYRTAAGRPAYGAPLLEPPIAPLIQSATAPSSTAVRPSISHLYAQHEPFLQVSSDLTVGSQHTSTSIQVDRQESMTTAGLVMSQDRESTISRTDKLLEHMAATVLADTGVTVG